MILMLTFLFLCLGLGLHARHFGAREHLVITLLAMSMTLLYLFVDGLM